MVINCETNQIMFEYMHGDKGNRTIAVGPDASGRACAVIWSLGSDEDLDGWVKPDSAISATQSSR